MEIKMASQVDTPEGRKWLVDMLKFGPTKITFTKKDGTERVMNCTLKDDLVIYQDKKTERTKEPNLEVCPVYDLDNKGWRSFRFDSVKLIEF